MTVTWSFYQGRSQVPTLKILGATPSVDAPRLKFLWATPSVDAPRLKFLWATPSVDASTRVGDIEVFGEVMQRTRPLALG